MAPCVEAMICDISAPRPSNDFHDIVQTIGLAVLFADTSYFVQLRIARFAP